MKTYTYLFWRAAQKGSGEIGPQPVEPMPQAECRNKGEAVRIGKNTAKSNEWRLIQINEGQYHETDNIVYS